MAIQITAYREWEDDGKKIKSMNCFYAKKLRAKSVQEILLNNVEVLENINEKNRFNVFYTLSSFSEGPKSRRTEDFEYCSTLAFDLDGAEYDKQDEYIKAFSDLVQLSTDQFSVVASGNGYHFLISLAKPMATIEDFKRLKPTYDLVCGLGNQMLFERGLPGQYDNVVFEPKRVFRLPGTKNIKAGKPEKMCSIVLASSETINFDLFDIAGVQETTHDQQMSPKLLNYRPANADAVLEQCAFMQHARDNSSELTEPQWYAALTITGRFEEPEKWGHAISDGHPGYNVDETDLKIRHAIDSTGPRTCKNISTMFEGCATCPHLNTCTSPVLLRPEGELTSESTGYWDVKVTKEGEIRYLEPNYNDLAMLFAREHAYVTQIESRNIMKWNGKFWEEIPEIVINGFLEKVLDPSPRKGHCDEFVAKLKRLNQRDDKWFTNDVKGYINMDNGVLDVAAMRLIKHDKSMGFTYCLPFDYDRSEECPQWRSFLNQIMPEADFQKILQEYMGYTLSYMDAQIGQKGLILKGEGSNGKSIIIDVLRQMVGEGNYATIDIKRVAGNPEARGKLFNKMLAVVEEIPGQGTLADDFFKTAVAGGFLDARRLYKGSFEFKCNSKFIISTNHDINFAGSSTSAILRRLLVIPFNVVIPYNQQDRKLLTKLSTEISGIFNWALEGLENFAKDYEFTMTEKVMDSARSSMEGANAYAQWFSEECELEGNTSTPVIDLFESFLLYHDHNSSVKRNITKIKFSKGLREYLKVFKGTELDAANVRVNGKVSKCVKGIKLAEEDNGNF